MTDPDLEKTPQEVADARAQGDVQLIDVREPHEWEAGRLDDSRLLPLTELSGQASTIDQDRPVVFVCRSGSRSLMAAQAFKRAGYDAWSMSGGLVQWQEEGRPLDPPDGTVAGH